MVARHLSDGGTERRPERKGEERRRDLGERGMK